MVMHDFVEDVVRAYVSIDNPELVADPTVSIDDLLELPGVRDVVDAVETVCENYTVSPSSTMR